MGLHLKGFILPLLILLPNLLLLFFAARNIPQQPSSPPFIFTVLERIGQVTCFTLPILFGTRIAEQPVNFVTWVMLFCLIIYYLCWIRFFWDDREFSILFKPLAFIPVPMALCPILYFILLAVWLHSYLFAVPAIVFAIGHLATSWSTYLQIK